ncbi:MAG: GIY-YIG nuclease family protein [Ignavibacteria bacterium]|nr:GIY-YIG nuclease family protein [Ignavibacteria bacterium]
MYSFCVYILASKKYGVLYTGVTNSLVKRVYEHKHNVNEGFTSLYFVKRLVYYEEYKYINDAIAREKCIKRWKREWKDKLINEKNPEWKDLYFEIGGEEYEKSMMLLEN